MMNLVKKLKQAKSAMDERSQEGFYPNPEKIKQSSKQTERSFTIIETLVALAILLPVVIETVTTQGSIINNNTYMHRMTEATWLAQRVMAQVEYNYDIHRFKDLEIESEQPFKIDSVESDSGFDYTYKLTIKEWKLPLFDLLINGGPKDPDAEDDDSSSSDGGGGLGGIPGIEGVIKSLFEDHILKIANVEVFWPEGARRDSVTLTLLLTNQKALDQHLLSKKKVMKELLADVEASIYGKKKEEKKEETKKTETSGQEGAESENETEDETENESVDEG